MIQQTLLFDPALLRPALADGALMLTPNRRLASRIRIALAAGQSAAPAAPVMAIADWLQSLWQQMIFRADPLALGQWILSSAQESALWEHSVRAGSVPLLRPAQAAEQSASAYRTLSLWHQLPLRSNVRDEFLAQPDTATFIEWLDRFERECSERNAIAIAERDRRVVEAASQNRIELPRKIIGIGFDDMPPLYRTLLQHCDFSELELPNRLRDAQCVGCDTFEQQLQAAALWVQQQMQSNPLGPFAIVVPNLNQQRAVVERALLDVLTPDHALPNQSRQLPPINFSAGEALAQTPLIRCALQLLELVAPKIELQTLLQLIRAPFFSGADAVGPIIAFIENVTDLRVAELSAAQVRQCADAVAQQFPEWPLPAQLQQLGEYVRRERLQNVRMSASAWAEKFSQWLTLLGWPGTRTLDSIEYQQHAQWQQALIDFAQFDQLGSFGQPAGTFDRTQALQRLRQLVQALVFQPQTVDTPIQVLGVLEAAGLQFSALWICEMGEDSWPPAASAHPLLPRELQRRLRMPRCDADREYSIAERLTQSLLASAEHVVVSYQREREEVECGASPLFASVPEINLTELLSGDCDELLPSKQRWLADNAHHALDTFESGNAPLFVIGERAHGGAGLFKDQAACPFRAFARHRLGARALNEPVAGLDAAERGNILHTALEMLWRELKTHAALIALIETRLLDLCERAAEFALQSFRERNSHRIGHRFFQLEKIRLTRLLQQWLSIECERGSFVVEAIEQRRDLQFAGLQLRLRVDRIDRLDDGRLLVVDYKTKNLNCRVEEWLGERPDEPQLPLYSVLLNDSGSGDHNNVAGIAFAQVRNEKPQFVGVGDEVLQADGFRTASQLGEEFYADSWSALQTRWKTTLENLAHDFIAGKAIVDPKAASACTYCDLASICRIAHQFEDGYQLGDGDIERNVAEETE